MIYLFSHLTQNQPVRRSLSMVRMKVGLWRERWQSGRNVLGASCGIFDLHCDTQILLVAALEFLVLACGI